MSVARLTVPVGIVPELADFTRHLWRFRGEDGSSVLSAPPFIYSVAIDDPTDVAIVTEEVRRLREEFDFGDRAVIAYGEVWPTLQFRDIEALHTFVRLIAVRASRDGGWAASGSPDGYETRFFGAFLMHALGFEWA